MQRCINICFTFFSKKWLYMEYPSYQRNQTGEVLSETNYCGTVNVLKLQTHIWIPIKEEEIPVKSLYARWVSDFLYKLSAKVHQHLFHFFFQKMTLYGISSFLVTILLWQHFVIRQDRYLQLNARRISDFFLIQIKCEGTSTFVSLFSKKWLYGNSSFLVTILLWQHFVADAQKRSICF